MKHVTSIGSRRPRESGGPGQPFEPCGPWVPAFAGMTDKRLILRKSSWFGLLVYSSEAFIRGADGAPGRVPAVFAVFAGNLSANDVAFSAEILGFRRLGDRKNSGICRCFAAVSAVFITATQELHKRPLNGSSDEIFSQDIVKAIS